MKQAITRDQVLNSQSALQLKREELRQIQDAIYAQNQMAANEMGDMGIQQLEMQRDDLAAALALGKGDSAMLAEIEERIAQLRTKLTEAEEKVNRARSAVAGLNRKLDEMRAQVASAEGEHNTLLLSHLRSEADVVQRAYIDSAREVVRQYLRIVALAELSRSIEPHAGGFVPFTEIAIPVSLQLASGAGIKYINDGVLFSSTHMGYFSDIPDAVAELRGDLQKAGIDLT